MVAGDLSLPVLEVGAVSRRGKILFYVFANDNIVEILKVEPLNQIITITYDAEWLGKITRRGMRFMFKFGHVDIVPRQRCLEYHIIFN